MKPIFRIFSLCMLLIVILPILASSGCAMLNGQRSDWRSARRDSSGLAPDAAKTREAVVQVYAARTVGWRGTLAVHTWITVKPEGAADYTRYEVMGWGVQRGLPAVRVSRGGADNYWFGAEPEKLVDRRGDEAQAMIARIDSAVKSYPYNDSYRTWPGPNSNTFVAHVARAVPELRLDLPPTAIGKDYIPNGGFAAASPSGTGFQLSLFGLVGVLAGLEEGVEFNLLGLSFGVDLNSPGIKLPGLGRIGMRQ